MKSKEENVRRSQFRMLVITAIAAFSALAIVSSASTARGSRDVTIAGNLVANYHFQPSKLTIDKGQKVHWSWSSNAPHNVTFRKLGKHSATGASRSYSLRFKKPGTFKYLCTVHGFKGKIVVS